MNRLHECSQDVFNKLDNDIDVWSMVEDFEFGKRMRESGRGRTLGDLRAQLEIEVGFYDLPRVLYCKFS